MTTTSSDQSTNPLASAVRAAGGGNPAILLYRIQYWMQYAKLKRHGHLWVARTRDEWAEETGLDFEAIKNAMGVLRRRGCIETEQHFFGPRCMTWVRSLHSHPGGGSTATLGGGSAATHNQGGTEQRDTSDTLRQPSGQQGEVKVSEQVSEDGMKVGEIADEFEEGKTIKTVDELQAQAELATSIEQYETLWHDGMEYHLGHNTAKLKGKEKGQINHIVNKLPKAAMSGPFLFLVVTRWDSYRTHLKHTGTWKKVPAHPVPGVVLATMSISMDWFIAESKKSGSKVVDSDNEWGI